MLKGYTVRELLGTLLYAFVISKVSAPVASKVA